MNDGKKSYLINITTNGLILKLFVYLQNPDNSFHIHQIKKVISLQSALAQLEKE